jgi:hypothetical protein
MPFDESAVAAPFPGVIVTAGPVGEAEAAAEPEAAAVPLTSDATADALAPGCPVLVVVPVVVLPVHAVSAAISAPAARAVPAHIARMATLYGAAGHK